jgi:hypothetical protein
MSVHALQHRVDERSQFATVPAAIRDPLFIGCGRFAVAARSRLVQL